MKTRILKRFQTREVRYGLGEVRPFVGTARSWGLAAVLPVVVLLLLLSGCATPIRSSRDMEKGIPVRFVYADAGAKEVCLVGSFNDWSAGSHCLARNGGTWFLDIFLPPGRYQYAFMLDGKTWREDPGAVLSEDTGFGTRNSILIVE